MSGGTFQVVIYVQHLLGTGHLVRMAMLSNSLVDLGATVTLISGGEPVAGLNHEKYRFVQLPPVHTNARDFSTLLDSRGLEIDDEFRRSRSAELKAAVEEVLPEVLIVETWPFGRRQMEFELIPLLENLHGRASKPVVISSIRDVLQRRTAKRRSQTLAQISRYVSAVIVHGDAAITPLQVSFDEAEKISCPVYYTGYLYRNPDICAGSFRQDMKREILVSAGGGAAGGRLLESAMEAALIDRRPWRILIGSRPSASELQRYRKRIGTNNNHSDTRVQIEPNRPDFPALLRECLASVSQYGYNTALDLIRARCPAVVVPYAEDGETEQETRARLFADRGLVEILTEDVLSPSRLLQAIDQAIERAETFDDARLHFAPVTDEENHAAKIVHKILEGYRSQ